jgi:beta-lactam-binding protein with PASTA domain/tRNA A-37 threonylcarbamoyl transferase component Bud32
MGEQDTRTDPRVGMLLAGRYRLGSRIDAGGMATVYSATDDVLGRQVAVKVMHPALAADDSFSERFRHEARNAARLSHPNVCPVYDYGESGNDLFIVMEFVDGTTLRSLLDRFGRLDRDTARHVARGAAAALDHAHDKGIIHRDVKPENILLTPDGQVKVVDFGIAKALGPRAANLTTDRPIGTVAYVAPEQITSTDVDGRADVYALGATTYEMLTGHPPFLGDSPQAVAAARMQQAPLNPQITSQIDTAVMKATSIDPKSRFASPGEFARALGDGPTPTFLTSTDHLPPPPPPGVATTAYVPVPAAAPAAPAPTAPPEGVDVLPFQTRLRHRKRRRARVYVAVALVLAIAGAVAYAVMPRPTTVPDLRGQTLEEAKSVLEHDGLELGDTNETFHDVAAVGTVVGSDPDPGVAVEDGTAVTLLVSKGVQLFDVPNVEGKPVDEAKVLMEQAGFSLAVGSEAHHDTVPKGAVISHDPDRPQAKKGTSFTAVVSKGPPLVAVPDVKGKTPAQARSAIEGAAFTFATREDFSESVDSGTVISSEPGTGAMAPKGSTVTAVVSKGPRPFPMPDLVGMTRGAAKDKARSLGLVVRNEYPVPGSGKPKGTVQGQNPPAGSNVRKGTPIDIYYSQ